MRARRLQFGVGGGASPNGDVKATTAEEAAYYPFWGVWGEYRCAGLHHAVRAVLLRCAALCTLWPAPAAAHTHCLLPLLMPTPRCLLLTALRLCSHCLPRRHSGASCERDPWELCALNETSPVRDYLRYYYNSTSQYLQQGGCDYHVDQVYVWGV